MILCSVEYGRLALVCFGPVQPERRQRLQHRGIYSGTQPTAIARARDLLQTLQRKHHRV